MELLKKRTTYKERLTMKRIRFRLWHSCKLTSFHHYYFTFESKDPRKKIKREVPKSIWDPGLVQEQSLFYTLFDLKDSISCFLAMIYFKETKK